MQPGLQPRPRRSRSWLAAGAPRDKLVVGIPYYGQGWTGVTGGDDGLFQPATGPAPATWEAGIRGLQGARDAAGPGFHRAPRPASPAAWLFDGTTFWTYDDPLGRAQKTLYVRPNGLGGAMVWSLDGDDANGTLTRVIDAALR